MKPLVVSMFILTLFASGALAGTATAKSASDNGSYDLTVTTTPDPANPELFTCKVVMKNSATGEVISAPSIQFRAGESAEVKTHGEKNSFRMKLSSDLPKNRATAECEYTVDGVTVFAPTLHFELK